MLSLCCRLEDKHEGDGCILRSLCMHIGIAGEHLRKYGHAINEAQRAKCLECGRTFVLEPTGSRYDQKFKDQVLAAYEDRMSTRGIQCRCGVCY